MFKEFNDVFGILMDDTEPLFNKLQELKMVDIYEALACFGLFCGDSFENKCAFVFRLFDFDNSNTIEKTELVKTVNCVLRAICKVVGLPLPKMEFLESLANACFMMINKEKNTQITFSEFYTWVSGNYEF